VQGKCAIVRPRAVCRVPCVVRHVPCVRSSFFQPGRPMSPSQKMFIGAGLGRTATTSMYLVFKKAGGRGKRLLSLHEVGPVFDILPKALMVRSRQSVDHALGRACPPLRATCCSA
jgi:hypothetical protein